jgi:hypothetical protein
MGEKAPAGGGEGRKEEKKKRRIPLKGFHQKRSFRRITD